MSGRDCLVTGGTGFLGSAITKGLRNKGFNVTIIDDLSNSNRNVLRYLDAEFIKGDISLNETLQSIKNREFRYIFNFGSPSSSTLFSLDGKAVYQTVKGMFNVIGFSRSAGTEAIIYPSSGTVYGNLPPPHQEYVKTRPKNMYACTKSFLENYSQTIQDERFKILGLRIFTGYGAGELSKSDNTKSVVPLFYDSISRNERPVVYGDGHQRRDFVYVDDVAKVAIEGAIRGVSGIMNVGSGESTSVNALIEMVNQKLGRSLEPVYIPSPAPLVEETRADIGILKEKLNYTPLPLKAGIDLLDMEITEFAMR